MRSATAAASWDGSAATPASDAYPLRTAATTYFATGAKVTPVEGTYELVTTQGHQNMEGRNLVRELPIETYKQNAGFPYEGDRSFVEMIGMDAHLPPNVSIYRNPPLDAQHQWGMAIDLNTCTGCNACVVACQSENNIPVRRQGPGVQGPRNALDAHRPVLFDGRQGQTGLRSEP